MKTLPTKTKSRTITETFVTIDGTDFEIFDLAECIEALEDSSYASRVVLYNKDMEKAFLKRKVVEKTAKGSVFRGDGYEKFAKRVLATRDKLWEKK